jgi:hypothetical protein
MAASSAQPINMDGDDLRKFLDFPSFELGCESQLMHNLQAASQPAAPLQPSTKTAPSMTTPSTSKTGTSQLTKKTPGRTANVAAPASGARWNSFPPPRPSPHLLLVVAAF